MAANAKRKKLAKELAGRVSLLEARVDVLETDAGADTNAQQRPRKSAKAAAQKA